ncbi:MAG TPA: indolepyruvate ferredoxin oxidoreductase subunit beta [Dehalococcoidia bacterium]|nr:indolepyruvate ferredoxin oxidoreductase subunit beta [Dehalococcoidia bacterium]
MTDKKALEVIICGVGGQGVVLMSELLGTAAVKGGIGVKGSEVLGMAQRGGSVFSNLRLGDDIYSPLSTEGTCDILLAVEPSEAIRNIQYLSRSSIVILNTTRVLPFTVFLGKSGYPEIETILEKLRSVAERVIALDASQIAREAGNIQTTNVVMMGALFGTGLLPISVDIAKEVVRNRVPAKAIDANLKAFDMGYEEVRKQLKAAA